MGLLNSATVVPLLIAALYLSKWLFGLAGRATGWHLSRRTKPRRRAIMAKTKSEEEDRHEEERVSVKSEDPDWVEVESHPGGSATNGGQAPEDWEGVVGFLHPFCNAGGGGERVLWAAIKATQVRWPKAVCVVYTGDYDATKSTILDRVENRFNIRLHPPTVVFLYLQSRSWVLSSAWPHFTLLGQSLGSLVMGYDAFSLVVPDIFIDTMGYSFTLALSKFLFPNMPTGAYVHYPTISTDMLNSLSAGIGKGVNAGTGKGIRGFGKRRYWQAYAHLYSRSGSDVDIVMTNSSWTQAHIQSLWGPYRTKRRKAHAVEVLFPPVAVEELEEAIELEGPKAVERGKTLLYVAQFRPEKNHDLILRSFSKLLHSPTKPGINGAKLVLIGSVRDSDDAKRVYQLRLLAHELKIEEETQFICDASWPEVLDWLRKSWVGVNGMWNEHFGIGVVEYQAAGLICVVNDSGGPKADIVVDFEGEATGISCHNIVWMSPSLLTLAAGYHASTESEYAHCFAEALSMSEEATSAMRKRARGSSRRFTEEAFAAKWVEQLGNLIEIQRLASKR
ncbi:MAG: asparagine-linked glycosylation protein [Alectoria fallacina]|uniref:GDP-Man:Man(3)GlcNAc(2)-PP-Dol alpha-1,2-mannosyltransferase n=1 Tax=Alectoria fallacina TaxID=1903189 RepID=A0A8H3F2T7_9LECA|nr:MAG: asparagine-linked glycosylation protein [Alectoria fallacina]